MSHLIVRPDGTLQFGAEILPCALGRGGIVALKQEGDGATPVGVWPLRRVLFRPDRISPPSCRLALQEISPGDGWCDDPAHADYNCPVQLPHDASCEALWRQDEIYDLIVVLGHNDDPVVADAGSAIFFHIARPEYSPTEGCVALALNDLLRVLEVADADWSIDVRAD